MRTRTSLNHKINSKEKGFAIPIAMGMGLIMILLATTAIVKSQDDRVAAISKKDSARSRIAAEAGINQIMGVMNQYRALANYPSSQWTSAALPGSINNECTTSSTSGTAKTNAINATIPTTNSGWLSVVSGDTSRGEYKLIDYTIPITAQGQLTVEGRVNRGDNSSESTSRIRVQFPIFDSGDDQVPPLWVRSSITNTPKINGNVLGPCTGTMTVGPVSPYTKYRSQMAMPSTPTLPTSDVISLSNISSIPNRELPRAGDTYTDVTNSAGTIRYYKYSVTSANFNDSFKVTIPSPSGISKVIVELWVTGSTIDLSNKVIVNQCGGSSNCGPFNFRIYGTGGTSGTLALNSNTRVCDALFHLSDYTVNDGSTAGSPVPTQECGGTGIKNTGVYWVNNWTASAGTTTTIIDSPRAIWSQTDTQPSDRIGPVSDWTPLQVP
jgi:Tfp pilus assembly protein PilX